MPEKYYFVVLFLLILIVLTYLYFNNFVDIKEVCINNHCFLTEIAKTAEERTKGLMFRENLPEDRGMLFVFDNEDIHSFWMKNTLISLDMIWIDTNNRIVYIEKNTLPCKSENCQSYKTDKKAKYVLEINSGLTDEFGIKIGDTAILPKNP